MIVSTKGSIFNLVLWQWRTVTIFVLSGMVAAVVEMLALAPEFILPAVPIGVMGGALGIFVSFRTNSSYDRWWEGRKLWGRMINSSRHLATQVLSYLPTQDNGAPSDLQRELIYRHINYVNMLRILLRQQDPFEDQDLMRLLPAGEAAQIKTQSNKTHALLHTQSEVFAKAARDGLINDFHLQLLDKTVEKLLDIQGGCERIKKTPLPRGYGFIAERLILIYSLLFPWVFVHEVGWWIIPINVIVCLSFTLISEVGRVLEDPFTMFYNGLPLSSISRMIEVNMRERLHEEDLPPLLGATDKGILM